MKKMDFKRLHSLLLMFICVSSCNGINLNSDSFENTKRLPDKYTCNGTGISPQLKWSGVPDATESFAIICDDPDAPTKEPFVHWVIFNIAGKVRVLNENVPPKSSFTSKEKRFPLRGVKQGKNSYGGIGYGSPCPPEGHGVHNYNFVIYALDIVLNLTAGATKGALLAAMEGHILASGLLTGTFER